MRNGWMIGSACISASIAMLIVVAAKSNVSAQCPHTTYSWGFCNIGQAPVCTQNLYCGSNNTQKESQAYANWFYCKFVASSGKQCQTGQGGSTLCKRTYKCHLVNNTCVRDNNNLAEQDVNQNISSTTNCSNGVWFKPPPPPTT